LRVVDPSAPAYLVWMQLPVQPQHPPKHAVPQPVDRVLPPHPIPRKSRPHIERSLHPNPKSHPHFTQPPSLSKSTDAAGCYAVGDTLEAAMTERKPPGTSWESFIERQIREAQEAGAFENLPGQGKPIPDVGVEYDPDWWAKKLLQRE